MQLSTTEPLSAQIAMRIAGAIAAALVAALLAGLCAGVGAFGARMLPPLRRIGRWPATLAAVAAGAFVVGLQASLTALGTPDAPTWPSGGWASQASRYAGAVLSGVSFVGVASAELFVVYVVGRLTRGFTQRLWLAVALLGGVIAGAVASGVLLLLLRYDPRLVPAFAATIVLLDTAVKAAQSAALLPFALDALAVIVVAAWFTRFLRRKSVPATLGELERTREKPGSDSD